MSGFGKILAVLNLAALLAFTWLAAKDLQMRKAWSYAVYRWDVAIEGMPVDETDADIRGRPRYYDFGDALSAELVGRPEIHTQEEFLDYRIDELNKRIDDDKIKPSRIDKLVEVVVALTDTPAERQALLASRTDRTKSNEEKLRTLLESKLKAIKDKKKKVPGSDKEVTDIDAKRLAIGRALVALLDLLPTDEEKKQKVEDAAAEPVYRWTANAVGVKMMSRVLDLQAQEYLAIGQVVAEIRREERTSFAYRHDSLIGELMDREHKLQEQKDKLAVVLAQAKTLEERAASQEDEVKERTRELNKKRDATEEELKKLEGELERLYYIRLRLRDANQTNQKMERDIRKLEKDVESENP